MPLVPCCQIFSFNPDSDFHRGTSNIIDRGFKRNKFSDLNRLSEINLIDGNGHATGPGMASSTNISRAIRDEKNRASVHCPRDVRVLGHHELAHFDLGLRYGFAFHDFLLVLLVPRKQFLKVN